MYIRRSNYIWLNSSGKLSTVRLIQRIDRKQIGLCLMNGKWKIHTFHQSLPLTRFRSDPRLHVSLQVDLIVFK